MKKGDLVDLTIEDFKLPNAGIGYLEEKPVHVKFALPGQTVRSRITKKRASKIQARLLEVTKQPDDFLEPVCSVNARCGGCIFQTMPYPKELAIKEEKILTLLKHSAGELNYQGLIASPNPSAYRNKMEFSFGDEEIDGELNLGMHETGSFYNVVCTDNCLLTHSDFDQIRREILNYFREKKTSYYHKRTHEGFLRHLIIRRAEKNGAILINLVTTSQEELNSDELIQRLLRLDLEGTITGILHTVNDQVADAVIADKLNLLYGSDTIQDDILGLKFDISPFSFFQVNTLGAEKLYRVVQSFAGEKHRSVIYDLYCGTGTIAQLLSKNADEVIGIELVEEAVEKAKENAKKNQIENCSFIAGDVLNEAHQLTKKADLIILDPPRDGIHPKAMPKILALKPESFIYVSCKAESLARDLPFFLNDGYQIEKTMLVDMFARTGHIESVVLLSKKEV